MVSLLSTDGSQPIADDDKSRVNVGTAGILAPLVPARLVAVYSVGVASDDLSNAAVNYDSSSLHLPRCILSEVAVQ